MHYNDIRAQHQEGRSHLRPWIPATGHRAHVRRRHPTPSSLAATTWELEIRIREQHISLLDRPPIRNAAHSWPLETRRWSPRRVNSSLRDRCVVAIIASSW